MGDFINNFIDPLTGYTGLPRIDSSNVASTIPVSNNTTNLTNLMSFTLTAPNFFVGGMATGSQGIKITAAGIFASNANVKTVNLLFGGTTLATITGAINGGSWRFEADVFRITDTSQTASVVTFAGGASPTTNLITVSPAENTLANVTVLVQGQGTLTGDVTENFLVVANI